MELDWKISKSKTKSLRQNGCVPKGLTLTEVVVAIGIGGLLFSGILVAYIQSAYRAEWSALSYAAQSIAWQRIEQSRGAKWDPWGNPPVDELTSTNFPPVVELMDVPVSKTNCYYGTNYVWISLVSTNPPLKLILSETVWSFRGRLYTNTAMVYRGPDQ